MKINLNSRENQEQISNVRSQIENADDLRKFDEFLANNDSFDFSDEKDVVAARACCGGDRCCTITIEVPLRMN
jgi:hypothetical protein